MKATGRPSERLKHSDPNYKSPVFPAPPQPYDGADFYKSCAKEIKAIADEFGLYTVERTANDLVQTGLKWRVIQIQAHSPKEHKDVEPVAYILFRANFPVAPHLIDIAVDSIIQQIGRNYVESTHPTH